MGEISPHPLKQNLQHHFLLKMGEEENQGFHGFSLLLLGCHGCFWHSWGRNASPSLTGLNIIIVWSWSAHSCVRIWMKIDSVKDENQFEHVSTEVLKKRGASMLEGFWASRFDGSVRIITPDFSLNTNLFIADCHWHCNKICKVV